jgi:hypothetical protein
MTKTNNLYSLAKELKEKKGRKLKIACDIDDVLRPLAASGCYWERVDYEDHKEAGSIKTIERVVRGTDERSKEIREDVKKLDDYSKERAVAAKKTKNNEEYKRVCAKIDKKYMRDWDYLSNRPYTTIASDLLKCLKEGLIEKLIFISSAIKNKHSVLVELKKEEFKNSFAKFPECSLVIAETEVVDGRRVPEVSERIKNACPDFDISIIDNRPSVINAVRDSLGPDKIYVLPDYMRNRRLQFDNVVSC